MTTHTYRHAWLFSYFRIRAHYHIKHSLFEQRIPSGDIGWTFWFCACLHASGPSFYPFPRKFCAYRTATCTPLLSYTAPPLSTRKKEGRGDRQAGRLRAAAGMLLCCARHWRQDASRGVAARRLLPYAQAPLHTTHRSCAHSAHSRLMLLRLPA